ncbi:V-type ATPase subunit [Candidatus Desantisbacteria bacterium]|nr:V-type ATPase subunit [Candidatus Desantisbacteria bacterium]
MTDTRYTYAVARVRALENYLLDRPTVERLISAEDGTRALSILRNTEYAEAFNDVGNLFDFEDGLSNELYKILSFLEVLSPEQHYIHLLRIPHDFYNLKILLETKYYGEPVDEPFSILGLTPLENLRLMIEGKWRDAPEYLKEASGQVIMEMERKGVASGNNEVFWISQAIDKVMWQYLTSEAKKSKNSFLITYYQKQIDLINIHTFLRLTHAQVETDYLWQMLFDDGSISKDFFLKLFSKSWDIFSEIKGYQDLVMEGWAEERLFWKYEVVSDNHILNYLKQANLIFFGPEPLIRYYLLKEMETNLLRIIFVAKLNHLSENKIRMRLRANYV